jgi:hypothetical protein
LLYGIPKDIALCTVFAFLPCVFATFPKEPRLRAMAHSATRAQCVAELRANMQ